MGSTHSTISQSQFKKNWRIKETFDRLTLWQNIENPTHQLQQYFIHDYDNPQTQQLYQLRKNNPYLVNAQVFDKDSFSCCAGDSNETKVIIEKIPLRMSNIQDIPYPDVLHLLDVCIRGYRQLSDKVGFFAVDEDQIGVNQKGQARVWLNTYFETSQIAGSRNVNESQMVQDILGIIFNSADHESYPPNIPNLSQFIGVPDRNTNFNEVSNKFSEFIHKYSQSYVPSNLQCVHSVGGAGVINDWCRSNNSYGFDQTSMRLSEQLFKSKLGQSAQRQTNNVQQYQQQSDIPINVSTRQDRPLDYTFTQNRVQQQQNAQYYPPQRQQVEVIQQRIINQSQPQMFQRPPQVEVFEQRIVNQSQPQFFQRPPQVFQRPAQVFQRPAQVFVPPVQSRPPIQPVETFQPAARERSQAPLRPVQFIASQRLIQVNNQPQRFIVAAQGSQVQQYQPLVIQKTQIGSQQFPQQQQRVYQINSYNETIVNNSSVYRSNYQEGSLQKEPSRKQINEGFIQTESRLQQQRVISQTIEIKESLKSIDSKKNLNQNISPSFSSYNQFDNTYKKPVEKEERKYQEYDRPAEDNLNKYGRAIPYSVNINEQINNDDKPSPDFLALLAELKKNSGKSEYTEVYSQAADTPSSNLKEDSSELSRKQNYFGSNVAYETYSQEATSSYGQDSLKYIDNSHTEYHSKVEQEEEDPNKYTGQYNFKKYEREIDPELAADLLKYQ